MRSIGVRRPLALALLAACGGGGASSDAGPPDAVSDAPLADAGADGALASPVTLASPASCCIGVNSTNVFFVDDTGSVSIMSVPISGGAVTNFAGSADNHVDALAADDNGVYTLEVGNVVAYPIGNGPGGILVQSPMVTSINLAAAGSNVYWTYELSGTVMTADVNVKDAGVVLASSQSSPVAVAVSGTDLFWTNASATNGAVMHMTLPSGTPGPLGSAQNASYIAVGASDVYWIELPGSLWKVPRAGGTPTEVAAYKPQPLFAVTSVASDGNRLFITAGGVYEVNASGQLTLLYKESASDLVVDSKNLYWIGVDSNTNKTILRSAPKP